MRIATYLTLIATTLLAAPVGASGFKNNVQESRVPEGPKIRVLLEKNVSSALLEAKGKYRVVRRDTGRVLSSGNFGKRFVIHSIVDGLRWGEEYPEVYQIAVQPLSPETSFFVNGIQYKGSISIYQVKDNNITVVNEVAIEDFVKSTLSLELNQSLSKEALSALAILARTQAYALALQGKGNNRPWDTSAKIENYFGYAVAEQPNGVAAAVDWTRFMVMESSKGVPTDIAIDTQKAEELALKGCDAQKILKTLVPSAKLNVTIQPNEVALRNR